MLFCTLNTTHSTGTDRVSDEYEYVQFFNLSHFCKICFHLMVFCNGRNDIMFQATNTTELVLADVPLRICCVHSYPPQHDTKPEDQLNDAVLTIGVRSHMLVRPMNGTVIVIWKELVREFFFCCYHPITRRSRNTVRTPVTRPRLEAGSSGMLEWTAIWNCCVDEQLGWQHCDMNE
jgi:hypothetical protein